VQILKGQDQVDHGHAGSMVLQGMDLEGEGGGIRRVLLVDRRGLLIVRRI
jgi:hypothetical protein